MPVISIGFLREDNLYKKIQLNIEIGGSIFIGSSEKCEVFIESDDSSISKLHCSIILNGSNYFLFKNDHNKKTLHNDKHFRDSVALKSGDKITLGVNKFEILFDPDNAKKNIDLQDIKKEGKKRFFGIL